MFQSVVDSAGLEKNQSKLQFSINHLHQHGKAPALKSTQKSKKYSIQAERSIQVETDGSNSVDEECTTGQECKEGGKKSKPRPLTSDEEEDSPAELTEEGKHGKVKPSYFKGTLDALILVLILVVLAYSLLVLVVHLLQLLLILPLIHTS